MKLAILSAAALAVVVSGCNTSATTDADIDQAFTAICSYVPAMGPVVAQLNAQLQNDYATAQTICAAGSPTSPVAAGVDILSIYLALEPYFAKMATPLQKAQIHKFNAALHERGLM